MNHLFQSTAFAAAAAILAFALRRYRAKTRYSIWLAASLKFLVPFSLLFDIGVRIARHAPAVAPKASTTFRQFSEPLAPLKVLTISFDQAPIESGGFINELFIVAWAAGLLIILASRMVRWLRIRRCVLAGLPLTLRDGTLALTSNEFSEPGVYGIRRPVLILPTRVALEAPEEQLGAIVSHERCHIRRHDNLTAALHMAVETIFWFYPLVWWIGSRLLEERERACDEEVLRQSDPEIYAAGILTVCELCLNEPSLPYVSGVTGGQLQRRIEQIMSAVVPPDLSLAKKSGLLSVIAVILLACVVAGAQSSSFEAVSIKSVPPELGGFPGQPGYFLRPRAEDPKRFRSTMRTESLIEWAYRIHEYRILGAPRWVLDPKVRYAVEAIAAQPATRGEMERMVQTLLTERFHLKFHRETREMSVFLLTTAKNGPKMEPTPAPELNHGDGTLDIGRGDLIAHSISMETLAGILTENSERPVLNRTGLTNKYDFTIHYDPDMLVDWHLGPVLPSMLKDIGLRMDSSRQPVELMVIDSIERPTEN